MRYLILVVAAVWMALGIAMAYVPNALSSFLSVETFGPWLRMMGLIPLVIGATLFFAAPRFHLSMYLRIVGALAVLKAMFMLVAPPALSMGIIDWYLGRPLWFLRLGGFVSIVVALPIAVVAVISLFEEDVI